MRPWTGGGPPAVTPDGGVLARDEGLALPFPELTIEKEGELKKRTLTNLYNVRPAWLDDAHKRLDAAVYAAHGWPADIPDEDTLKNLLALNPERSG